MRINIFCKVEVWDEYRVSVWEGYLSTLWSYFSVFLESFS